MFRKHDKVNAMTVYERPWGYYEILATDNMVQIKKIVVHDQQQLSLQTHEHRDEYWFISSGNAFITVDDYQESFTAGMTLQILRGEKHRIKSLQGDLVMYEVQVGSYLGEDDIVRYEDNYGRA